MSTAVSTGPSLDRVVTPPWSAGTDLGWLRDASQPFTGTTLRQAPIRPGLVDPDGLMLRSPEGVA